MTENEAEHGTPAHPCCVCRRDLAEDERNTCKQCVGATRSDLHGILNAYALLPDIIGNPLGSNAPKDSTGRSNEKPMPGGDALVLAAGGGDGRGQLREPHYGDDDLPGDPLSVAAELGRHEDDWRKIRHEPAALTNHYVSSAAVYLLQHLGWAGSRHPDFPEFARDIRRLRHMLEQATGTAETVVRAQAPCFDCGGQLVRYYRDAYGQGPREGREPWGLAEDWTCRACKRVYDPAAYWLAVRARLENEATTSQTGDDQVHTERHVIDLGPAGRVVFTVDPRWLDLPDDKADELRQLLARARWLANQIKPDGNAA